jgi:hypothetical protein
MLQPLLPLQIIKISIMIAEARHQTLAFSYNIRVVPVVVRLYFNLIHIASAFSLSLPYQRSISRLQYPTHSHISISHINILSQLAPSLQT